MAPVPAKSFFDMVSTEFNVATEDLLDLEIHDTDKQIQYFYDGKRTGGGLWSKTSFYWISPRPPSWSVLLW